MRFCSFVLAALVLRIRKGEQITESQSSQICMCCDQSQQPLETKDDCCSELGCDVPGTHLRNISSGFLPHSGMRFWWILIYFSQFLSLHVGGYSGRAALARRDWCDVSFHHHDNLRYGVMCAACGGRPGHYLSGGTGDPAVTSWPQALGLPVPRYRLEISHSLTGGRGDG